MVNKTNKLAPVVVFAYRRVDLLERVISSLLNNPESQNTDLFIFVDGPSNIYVSQEVKEVIDYCRNIHGFKSLTVHTSEVNIGLAKSIVSGVTEVLKTYPSVIVLEDDTIPSKMFLNFMNSALKLYEQEKKVWSIHGYRYPTKVQLENNFFLKGADCWGWATWADRWSLCTWDASSLYNELVQSKLIRDFDFNYSFRFSKMLKNSKENSKNSWAIVWHAFVFLNNGYTLYPRKSLIFNAGLDGSGTNSGVTTSYNSDIDEEDVSTALVPVVESSVAKKQFEVFFVSQLGVRGKIRYYLSNLFGKIL